MKDTPQSYPKIQPGEGQANLSPAPLKISNFSEPTAGEMDATSTGLKSPEKARGKTDSFFTGLLGGGTAYSQLLP